ncbi:hypothetical protein [Mucilaginibacter celer]|nr:hypothetical protein [Mucilaginibacter celer]
MKIHHNSSVSGLLSLVLSAIICLSPSFGWSQSLKAGSVEYLKQSNGIGNLLLGSSITELPSQNLSYLDGDSSMDPDSCLKYQYHDENLLALGDSLSLDAIGLRTYRDKIVNIYLFFKIKDAYKVLSNFLDAYGPFTSRPDAYADIYNWDTSRLSLTLRYEVKADLGVAIFTSKELENVIAADKTNRIAKASTQSLSALY